MITIYAHMKEDVEKKLNSLKKKAKTYGLHFDFTMGEEHPEMVNIYRNDPITHTTCIVSKHVVNAIDVDIKDNGLIKANGWRILAKIEHGKNGYNMVFTFEGQAQESWYTLPPKCDHCKINRYRKITFLVQHENGEIKQVGDTCLNDYTGINPKLAIAWAKIKDLTEMSCDENAWNNSHKMDMMYSVLDTIANAIDIINNFGYVKSSEHKSTKNRLIELMENDTKPSEKAMEEAKNIIEWLKNLDVNCASDIELNCLSLVKTGYVKFKHFGFLAYIPIAYRDYVKKQAEILAKKQSDIKSNYVGNIGDKITLKCNTAVLLSSWENAYGITFLYKFTDADNHVYIWYASKAIELKDDMIVKGTVKAHNEREGVKQTVITRCKVS